MSMFRTTRRYFSRTSRPSWATCLSGSPKPWRWATTLCTACSCWGWRSSAPQPPSSTVRNQQDAVYSLSAASQVASFLTLHSGTRPAGAGLGQDRRTLSAQLLEAIFSLPLHDTTHSHIGRRHQPAVLVVNPELDQLKLLLMTTLMDISSRAQAPTCCSGR